MSISEGTHLPDAELTRMGPNGPETVSVKSLTEGRKVVIFAVPGAFTPTCHSAHVPSFIRTKDALAAKGVDEVICVAVNDPFVMQAWGEATGASAAGIAMLSDGAGAFTQAIGQTIDQPGSWVGGRSKRYALMAEDGVVKVWHPETGKGCEISGGEAMLDSL
ncbi:MAG: peroxiredoxin [Rhodobacter sp.]|nr:peroxiredoxin [Paracoccaceae bacterium]MCB1376367.1 peroxiredoxin [Paracoccaceae bacterium]MCB1410634.1 peroxiredoxin [Paracoccaceae bacterium]MCC0081342.1 peroxiredoxin [Rhodobacter sp.]